MANKFSDYTNQRFDDLVKNNSDYINNFKNQNAGTVNSVNDLINKYSNMDRQQLFNEFMKVAEQKKREGTLSLEYLQNIRQTMFPYLDQQQQQMFDTFMNYLR